MPIFLNEAGKEFHLNNDEISYIFCIARNSQPQHLYYGKAIPHSESFMHLNILRSTVLSPCPFADDMDFSLNTILHEYPSYGTGDYRIPAFQLQGEDGSRITDFQYRSHRIFTGKNNLKGLPYTYCDDNSQATTLELTLVDDVLSCELKLFYTIFENLPVIARSAKFTNCSSKDRIIRAALSMSVELDDSDYDFITLDGAWCRERHITRARLRKGIQSVASSRGASSPNHNPACFLARPNTDEFHGECYAFSLLYSGNFTAFAEVDSYDNTRIGIGINPFEFQWNLKSGESFETPEAVTAFADRGLNGLSSSLHRLVRSHIIRGSWKERERPILFNNWEATYFDFNEEKLLELAKQAKDTGIELFVLDDGWFGRRNDDSTSLGDWFCNLEKLPQGIKGLSEKVKSLGLLFGMWFEPEMVSEASELMKRHSEWVVGAPNRSRSYGRSQFVLDMSNQDVVDYLFHTLSKVIEEGDLDYIKWDMNRNITEAFGAALPPDDQMSFFHRYILGTYELYERLGAAFPKVLFESCAAGGGRFDLGMMYHAPQGWTSDDTDPVERLKIQYGTSLLYPLTCMGSHVSASPNHQTGRMTTIDFRFHTAMFGLLGYELDITRLEDDDLAAMKKQISLYKKYRSVLQFGDFYRLKNPFENAGNTAWMAVSQDKSTALCAHYKVLAKPNPPLKKLRLTGLNENSFYRQVGTDRIYSARELMNRGITLEPEFSGIFPPVSDHVKCTAGKDRSDFTSYLYIFEEKKQG
jgi:alpha-galactosidase